MRTFNDRWGRWGRWEQRHQHNVKDGADVVIHLMVMVVVLGLLVMVMGMMGLVQKGYGQVNISTQTYGTLPNSRVGGAWRAVGAGTLAARPATCAGGRDTYICTGAGCTSGQNIHYCTASNTWTVQGQAAGGGITSINSLVDAAQSIVDVDDTNVTLTIGSAGGTHTLTMGWAGTLAKARQHAQTAYLDAAQVFAGVQTIQAATTDLLVLSNSGADNWATIVTNKDRVKVWDSGAAGLAEFQALSFYGSGVGLDAGTVPTASLVEGGNLPSSGQKAALAGSSGTPGVANVYVTDTDTRMTNSRAPTTHASTHQNSGSDEIATATPGANAIPKAGAGGLLAIGWLGSGTPDGTKFLRDDGVLAVPPGGGGGTWGSITGTLSSQTDLNTALLARPLKFTGSATIDFPNLVAGQCSAYSDVTVTGAAVGDVVAVGLPIGVYDSPGMVVQGVARATNTVSLSACNTTGASVNLASATYKVVVLQ